MNLPSIIKKLITPMLLKRISYTIPRSINATLISKKISTSIHQCNLDEFFDKKTNWDADKIKVGRPWRIDELRLKSNSDLHKLWYVLLKERNMIMTMEEEFKRECELFPSPERLEKVEESMENLLDVITERDRTINLLETGEDGLPGKRWTYNQLGIGFWRKCREYLKPLSEMFPDKNPTIPGRGAWQFKYLRLMREKRLSERSFKKRMQRYEDIKLEKAFPSLRLRSDEKKEDTIREKVAKGSY